MSYKINEEKLKKVLKPYGLEYENKSIKGYIADKPDATKCVFFNLEKSEWYNKIIDDIKNNDITNEWVSSIRLLIPVLHEHFDEVFKREYTYEEVVECLKKLKLNVENGCIMIEDNTYGREYKSHSIGNLLDILNDNSARETSSYEDLLVQLIKSHIEE